MAATMGKDGFINLNAGTTASAYMDSWTLNTNIDVSDVTAYGDSSKNFVSGLRSWTVTAGGTLDRSDSDQAAVLNDFESTATSTALSLKLYDSTSYWSGSAFVTSQSVNSNVGDKVTVSWTFQGTGDLSYITT